MCSPGEVQGHAIPAFQQRGPSRKGLFCYSRALNQWSWLSLRSVSFIPRLLTGLVQPIKTRDTPVSDSSRFNPCLLTANWSIIMQPSLE